MKNQIKEVFRAYKEWKKMGNCNCVECGKKLTRSRAYTSLFCVSCANEIFGWAQVDK
jgi:hypothetical protein